MESSETTADRSIGIQSFEYNKIAAMQPSQLVLHSLSSAGGVDTLISLADLKEVTKQVWDARTEWFQIGINLKLKATDLTVIERRHRGDPDSCFSGMLESWLKGAESTATWKGLVVALQSVGMDRLADKIQNLKSSIICQGIEGT